MVRHLVEIVDQQKISYSLEPTTLLLASLGGTHVHCTPGLQTEHLFTSVYAQKCDYLLFLWPEGFRSIFYFSTHGIH